MQQKEEDDAAAALAAKKDKNSNKMWKQKFIRIRQWGDEFDKKMKEEEEKALEGYEEDSVGPEHFRIGAKLGQGSFG